MTTVVRAPSTRHHVIHVSFHWRRQNLGLGSA